MRQELIKQLLKTSSKKIHLSLFKKNAHLIDLDLAEELKNTYYDSWTKEPQKTRNAANALKVLSQTMQVAEVEALACWVQGIADLTEGNIEKAIIDLDEAAKIFNSLHKTHQAAQTQVGKLIALALLGKYDEAIRCGEAALKIFEKHADELAAGKIEMNLSNVVARRELHRAAEKYCLSARRRFQKLQEIEWLTLSENSLANTYAELNEFRLAEKFYARASRRAQTARMAVTEAEIEASMGNLALFRGRFDEALKLLERARRKYDDLKMPHQSAIAELEIADIYLELNLTREAAEIYEKVADKLKKLKLQGEEARARANFGRVSIALLDTKRAKRELKKSARLYILEKNAVGAAAVKLSEASLELDLKNYQKTLNYALAAETLLEKLENLRLKLYAGWLKAEALRNTGQFAEAETLLVQIYSDSIENEQPNTAQAAQISLGNLAVQRSDFPQAEKHFRQAVKLIEILRAPLAAEEFRMAFLANKLAPYENLAKIYLSQNKIAKAFTTIESARARVLAENLVGNIQPPNTRNDEDSGELPERLANLREQLNYCYSRLNRADETEIEHLQHEARRREKQIADVMRQIESTRSRKTVAGKMFPANAALTFKQIQSRLGASKALIEFVNFDGILSAFIVTGKKIRFAENLATEAEITDLLENLRFQFDAVRYGAENLDKFIDGLKQRADFYLEKLYEKLLAPLAADTNGKNLVVVPVGALHYVPFHALFDGTRYAIETHEVVYSPSATVWEFLASKTNRKLENALLIGFADERIPLVNAEIETLQHLFPASESRVDEQATFAAFTQDASKFDILHLACHGSFRPENPLFSSLHLADGWITVRDVCSQKLQAEIVTLSACETGLNKIFAGDEILGLARGFLSAGANSLLLSLWTVNDETAAELMKTFYLNLQTGKAASEALKIAQGVFIARKIHPYFWAPFILIGR